MAAPLQVTKIFKQHLFNLLKF